MAISVLVPFSVCLSLHPVNTVTSLITASTDSKKLKDVVLDPKRKYPFRAVIKVVRYGTMYGFKFFPPNTPITQEDRDNFEYYKRNKYKKNR